MKKNSKQQMYFIYFKFIAALKTIYKIKMNICGRHAYD